MAVGGVDVRRWQVIVMAYIIVVSIVMAYIVMAVGGAGVVDGRS